MFNNGFSKASQLLKNNQEHSEKNKIDKKKNKRPLQEHSESNITNRKKKRKDSGKTIIINKNFYKNCSIYN